MKKMVLRSQLLALVLLSLTSCTLTDFKKQIGIEKKSPDEFMVQPRERLKIPDQAIALPTPKKAPDPALAAKESGREALFGDKPVNNIPPSSTEQALLAKTGAQQASDSIRTKVEKDYNSKEGVFGTEQGSTLNSVLDPFGYNAPVDPVVDAKKENARIKAALKKGEKINPDDVQSINPKKDKMDQEGVF
jgi:hypothetical protein